MLGIRDRKSLLIVSGLIGAFLIFSVFVVPRINPPPPKSQTAFVFAGDVSRGIVGSGDPQTSRPGTFTFPYRPHHIDFTSSNGPVDVYVVGCSFADPKTQVEEMTRLTDQLRDRQPPEDALGSASGETGRIDVGGWSPVGWGQILVLIRSQNDTEVRWTVHYGPD